MEGREKERTGSKSCRATLIRQLLVSQSVICAYICGEHKQLKIMISYVMISYSSDLIKVEFVCFSKTIGKSTLFLHTTAICFRRWMILWWLFKAKHSIPNSNVLLCCLCTFSLPLDEMRSHFWSLFSLFLPLGHAMCPPPMEMCFSEAAAKKRSKM